MADPDGRPVVLVPNANHVSEVLCAADCRTERSACRRPQPLRLHGRLGLRSVPASGSTTATWTVRPPTPTPGGTCWRPLNVVRTRAGCRHDGCGGRGVQAFMSCTSLNTSTVATVWRSPKKNRRVSANCRVSIRVRLYVSLRRKDTPSVAAAKASFSTATAYRIESDPTTTVTETDAAHQPPRWTASSRKKWSRCWSSPRSARGDHLRRAVRGRHRKLPASVRRTLERRVRRWRAVHGPEQEVIFAQMNPPGRLGLSDFTATSHPTSPSPVRR